MALDMSSREIWLYDWFGRFLDNDIERDTIVSRAPQACRFGKPGLYLLEGMMNGSPVQWLEKRESRPMPLPDIRTVPLENSWTLLQVTNETGPFGIARHCYISSEPSGVVFLNRPTYEYWEAYVPMPARTAAVLFPGFDLTLTGPDGETLSSPETDLNLHLRIAGRSYPAAQIMEVMTQLGALEPGESTELNLPPLGDAPALTIRAARPSLGYF